VHRETEHCAEGDVTRPDSDIGDIIVRQRSKATVDIPDLHIYLQFAILTLFAERIVTEIIEPHANGDMINFFIIPYTADCFLALLDFVMVDEFDWCNIIPRKQIRKVSVCNSSF